MVDSTLSDYVSLDFVFCLCLRKAQIKLLIFLSELVFLCRWHSRSSSAEPWWTAAITVWMWGAEHGAPGPRHLHPPISRRHKAAHNSHQGKNYKLSHQWSVCLLSITAQIIKCCWTHFHYIANYRSPVTDVWNYAKIKSASLNICYTGYQRELNYKDAAGAYTTFGSGPGNTWWEYLPIIQTYIHKNSNTCMSKQYVVRTKICIKLLMC